MPEVGDIVMLKNSPYVAELYDELRGEFGKIIEKHENIGYVLPTAYTIELKNGKSIICYRQHFRWFKKKEKAMIEML